MGDKSHLTINKSTKNFNSFGFWINNDGFGDFLTITPDDDNPENVYISKKELDFIKIYKKTDKNTPIKTLRLNKYNIFYWMFIQVKDDNGLKLEINLNNESKKIIDIKPSIASFKSIKFEKINGYIGKIWTFDNGPTKPINPCKHYLCFKNIGGCKFNLKHESVAGARSGNIIDQKWDVSNANDCIKYCYKKNKTTCNIKDCQQICIGCLGEGDGDKGEIIDPNDRDRYCPWYNNIRSDPTPPSAPKIRGFSDINDDKPYILLEWRKPNHNLSKIVNYIIEIKETLYKHSTDIILVNGNEEVYQEKIDKLKPKTSYEINVRAVGEFLELNKNDNISAIGPKSNTVKLTTKGNNSILGDIYGDMNQKYNNTNYRCNRKYSTSDHILDKLNSNDIDLYKYAKSIQ